MEKKMKYRNLIEHNQCILCNSNTNIEVDHIDSDHSNSVPSNLQALCKNCHILKTEFDRKKLGLYFSSIIFNVKKDTKLQEKFQNRSFRIRMEDLKTILSNSEIKKINNTFRIKDNIYKKNEDFFKEFYYNYGQYAWDENICAIKMFPQSDYNKLSENFAVLYDLLSKNNKSAYFESIKSDLIFENKLRFTFNTFLDKARFKHNFYDSDNNKNLLREIINVAYGNDYKVEISSPRLRQKLYF
tara:strand:- start:47 stop:772 length:726 start_codon:yes stop_codon:yes gene_type:complete